MITKHNSLSENKICHSFQLGEHAVTLTTNYMAKLCDSSVMVQMGDTVVLAALSFDSNPENTNSFLAMTVQFVEKTYASGYIPGGYFKREGRPSEAEILKSRIIDRTLRPCFEKGFSQETQLVVYVLSHDPKIPNEIPGLMAASAAVKLAGLPFNGTTAAVKVGHQDGKWLLNPSKEQLKASKLDLHVSTCNDDVVMVECQSNEIPEDELLDALDYAKQHCKTIVDNINTFCKLSDSNSWEWKKPESIEKDPLYQTILEKEKDLIYKSTQHTIKKDRQEDQIRVLKYLIDTYNTSDNDQTATIEETFNHIIYSMVREDILMRDKRIDNRSLDEVRSIDIDLGILPRAHGSAVFQRGETQTLVTTTVASEKNAQMIETLDGDETHRLLLHYNFPPFCVNDVRMLAGPKRREIGHGNLAKRSLEYIIPSSDEFPYAIRLVSEVMESNGSSSMATICGACLSLMDAGVPVKKPVAGIAMGLVKENKDFKVLSDILGDEDHLGDMDFKVAGTRDGVTSLQMDIKTDGITREILAQALTQAKQGRLSILDIMDATISTNRSELSKYAPRTTSLQIKVDKIRNVIGKGGVTIRELTEKYGVEIDISDDGIVKISSSDQSKSDQAIEEIKQITCEIQTGQCYAGNVSRILDFGAVITFKNGETGFLHISEISNDHVNDIKEHLSEKQELNVKVIGLDNKGRLKVSTRQLSDSAN